MMSSVPGTTAPSVIPFYGGGTLPPQPAAMVDPSGGFAPPLRDRFPNSVWHPATPQSDPNGVAAWGPQGQFIQQLPPQLEELRYHHHAQYAAGGPAYHQATGYQQQTGFLNSEQQAAAAFQHSQYSGSGPPSSPAQQSRAGSGYSQVHTPQPSPIASGMAASINGMSGSVTVNGVSVNGAAVHRNGMNGQYMDTSPGSQYAEQREFVNGAGSGSYNPSQDVAMAPPPSTTPTSRSSSVHLDSSTDNSSLSSNLNNGTKASSVYGTQSVSNSSANSNPTGHPNALPGYLLHPPIQQQAQQHQQSSQNSSRYPGQETMVASAAIMGENMSSASWSADTESSRLVWDPEQSGTVPKNEAGNVYREPEQTGVQNSVQNDMYHERVNLNSRLKTMILNKQQQQQQSQQLNHQMQQYNHQVQQHHLQRQISLENVNRNIDGSGSSETNLSSPGEHKSHRSSQSLCASSNGSGMIVQNVDGMNQIMNSSQSNSVNRKQIDTQSSSETNFLAKSHHPQNRPSVLTSEGGGFPWDWVGANSTGGELIDSGTISAMENFIKYASSVNDQPASVDHRVLNMPSVSASMKNTLSYSVSDPTLQQKSGQATSQSTNGNLPRVSQKDSLCPGSAMQDHSELNSSATLENSFKNKRENLTSAASIGSYKFNDKSSTEIDDKSLQKQIFVTPDVIDFHDATFSSTHDSDGMNTRTGRMAMKQSDVYSVSPRYEDVLKNEDKKSLTDSSCLNSYLSQKNLNNSTLSLKLEEPKTCGDTLHCQKFGSRTGISDSEDESEMTSLCTNSKGNYSNSDKNDTGVTSNNSTGKCVDNEEDEKLAIKMDKWSYKFQGDGGPAVIEKMPGAWCCRQGGIETPTPEHLRDGCCQGFQTADEQDIKQQWSPQPDSNVEDCKNNKVYGSMSAKEFQDHLERLKNNVRAEVPDCNCFPPDKCPPEPGSYYTHLGTASSLTELRSDLEKRTGLKGKALRVEKVMYTGKEGKTTQGCPLAKWIIRRASLDEKILCVVKHRQGHKCPTAWIVVVMVAWEGVPSTEADRVYNLLTHKLNRYGLPTTRRCATNEPRTCACQGLDPDTCGASFSFGCSWSMYYNGCKYARSKTVRKFRLSVRSEEQEVEERMHVLATLLSPLYQSLVPEAFKNQTQFEREASECRLGFKPGRPFSGVTACIDFCAHSHRDLHNMNNGCTVVVSLTKNRTLSKPDDEQLHVLPLYVMDDTDEFGSKEAQETKTKNGAVEVLTKFPCEVRVRAVPLQPCRRHGKKRKEDEPDAVIGRKDPSTLHRNSCSLGPASMDHRSAPMSIDMASMLEGMEAQLQSSQVSSTVLDSPVSMYQGWGYHHSTPDSHNMDMYHHTSPSAAGSSPWSHHRSQAHQAWMAAEAQHKKNWNFNSSWGTNYGTNVSGTTPGFSAGDRDIKVDPDSTTNHGSSLNSTAAVKNLSINPSQSPGVRSVTGRCEGHNVASPTSTLVHGSGQLSPISPSGQHRTAIVSSPFIFQQPSSPWRNPNVHSQAQINRQQQQHNGSLNMFADSERYSNSAEQREVTGENWSQNRACIPHNTEELTKESQVLSPGQGNSKQSPLSNISLQSDQGISSGQQELTSMPDRPMYPHLPTSPLSPQSHQSVISPQQTSNVCSNSLPSPSTVNTGTTSSLLNTSHLQKLSPLTPANQQANLFSDTAVPSSQEINSAHLSKTPERSISVPLPLTPSDTSASNCSNSSRGGWITPDRHQSWDYNINPPQSLSPTQASPFRIPKGHAPSRSSNYHSNAPVNYNSAMQMQDLCSNASTSPTMQGVPSASSTPKSCKGFLKPYPPGEVSISRSCSIDNHHNSNSLNISTAGNSKDTSLSWSTDSKILDSEQTPKATSLMVDMPFESSPVINSNGSWYNTDSNRIRDRSSGKWEKEDVNVMQTEKTSPCLSANSSNENYSKEKNSCSLIKQERLSASAWAVAEEVKQLSEYHSTMNTAAAQLQYPPNPHCSTAPYSGATNTSNPFASTLNSCASNYGYCTTPNNPFSSGSYPMFHDSKPYANSSWNEAANYMDTRSSNSTHVNVQYPYQAMDFSPQFYGSQGKQEVPRSACYHSSPYSYQGIGQFPAQYTQYPGQFHPRWDAHHWDLYGPSPFFPMVPEAPRSEPIGEVTDYIENEECFKDSQMGGVAIALGHGSVLFECAKHELHATTALRRPNRLHPTRISLVFYQHRNLNRAKHGWDEWEEKMRLRKLGITTSTTTASSSSTSSSANVGSNSGNSVTELRHMLPPTDRPPTYTSQFLMRTPTYTTTTWTTLFPMHPCMVTGPYQEGGAAG
ncbi:uncharacterized protein LOC134529638 [Bacillus rossius redtenbacheri]|uniref:uncharacterized protein LOC134529638 n=1 Tax=Bacillus rossius redtenbacheri TaxID=93214 RepID=UPI002FDDB332